jgi:PKD repeat protein
MQDDLAVLTNLSTNGFGYAADDHAAVYSSSATALSVGGNSLSGSGVVERMNDLDSFRFSTSGGSVAFTASVGAYVLAETGASAGATLDLRLELRNSSGALVASADTASLGETLTASLAAGTYYLVVASHGSYGDIGTYSISGTAPQEGATPTPPVAQAGGPYSVPEGGGIALSGASSTGTSLTYVWDLDGDGVFGESGAGAARGAETGVAPTFSAIGLDGPSSYTVSLRVTDSANQSSTTTATVNVTNAAPTAVITGAPSSSPEGTQISLTGSATDPGSADTFTLAWNVTKNGSPYTTGSGTGFNFTPNDAGTYVVTLTVTDDDGGTNAASRTISASNVAPTPSINGTLANGVEGASIAMTASASDPGALDTVTYAWSVTRNGLAYATGSGVDFALSTNDNGTYVITLTATDDDGGAASTSKTVSMTNAAPTATAAGAPPNSAEGTAINMTGSATDAGSADTFTYGWTVTKNGSAFKSGSGASFTFTPTDNGTYVVTLTATDDDGGSDTDAKTIIVNNVAPTAAISWAPTSSPEGTAISMTGSATDPGSLDTLSFAWTVTKDGSPFATGAAASFSFTPDDDGAYVVGLTVTDDDGGTGTANKTIAVTNVAPTMLISGPAWASDGSQYSLQLSWQDPGDDTITQWTINWGDGQVETIDGNPSAASHTFTQAGPHTISASATDEDGTYYAAGSFEVLVSATPDTSAPTAMLGALSAVAAGSTSQSFSVTYTDDVFVDLTTLGGTNLRVTGPNGFDQLPTLVSSAASDGGKVVTATYQFTAPGGTWNSADNGTYTLGLEAQQVADGSGNYAAAATLGTLSVKLPVPDRGGNTLGTASYIGIVGPGYSNTISDFVSKGDRNDYYRLRVQQQTKVNFTLYNLTDNASLQLVNASGVALQTSNRSGALSETLTSTLSAGTYYLRVYYGLSGFTPYSLRVLATAPTATPDLAGNSPSAAAPIGTVTVGYSKRLTERLTTQDLDDYYVFHVQDALNIELTLGGLSANAQLALLDASGNSIQYSGRRGTYSEKITRTLSAGTYYVRVFGTQPITTNYVLDLKASA